MRRAGLGGLLIRPLKGRNDPKTAATLAGGLLSNSPLGKTPGRFAKDRSEETSYSKWAGNHRCGEAHRATLSCGTPRSADSSLEIPPTAGLE